MTDDTIDITVNNSYPKNDPVLKPWTPPTLQLLNSSDIASGIPTSIAEGTAGGVAS